MTATGKSRKDTGSSMSARGSHVNLKSTKKSKKQKIKKKKHTAKSILSSDFIDNETLTTIKNDPKDFVKNKLCIGTWNVTSLVSDSSKLHQLSKGIKDYGIDLLGVTETHMPGSGRLTLDNGEMFVYSGSQDGTKRRGVAIQEYQGQSHLLHPRF